MLWGEKQSDLKRPTVTGNQTQDMQLACAAIACMYACTVETKFLLSKVFVYQLQLHDYLTVLNLVLVKHFVGGK